jgi:RNA recognition motif-containing protein
MENNNDNANLLKIFVGNVPFQCTKKEFIEIFKGIEGFHDGDIVNKLNSDSSRGCGFITFISQDYVNKFMESKQQIILKNRILRFTKYFNSDKKIFKSKMNDKNYLFIKNVPKSMKPIDIKNIFKKYGEIGACFTNTYILTGEPKGSAVVEFIDTNVYDQLLTTKQLVIDNDIILGLTKWKQCIKIKKDTIDHSKKIQKLGFNINRNINIFNGL